MLSLRLSRALKQGFQAESAKRIEGLRNTEISLSWSRDQRTIVDSPSKSTWIRSQVTLMLDEPEINY